VGGFRRRDKKRGEDRKGRELGKGERVKGSESET